MDIIHFGDIHVWRLQVAWNDLFYPKRYLGTLNLLLNRRKKFPPELGQQVVQEILQQAADLVIFSGDFTTQSFESEFAACAELFAPLRDKWQDRFFVIPGNHDRYTPHSVAQGHYEKYFPYGVMQNGLRTLEIDADNVVIGFDASRPFKIRSNGLFDDPLETTLRAALGEQRDAGRRVVLVGHFPASYPDDVPIKWDHELLGRERLIALIEEFEPVVYLHGHKHIRWRRGNQVNCGAAGMISDSPSKQAGFVKLRLGAAGLEQATGYALSPTGTGLDSVEL